MKSRAERIVELKRCIAELTAKENKYSARREKLEAKLKALEDKDDTERNALILDDCKCRLDSDPKEFEQLRKRLDQRKLTDEQRRLFGLPPKNNPAKPDAARSATDPAGDGHQAPATADSDSATTAQPDATESDAPESATVPASDEHQSSAPDVDGESAAPAHVDAVGPHTPASAADPNPVDAVVALSGKVSPKPAKPAPGATARQIAFITNLIAQNPDAAQQIGVDVQTIHTMSRSKASWVIKTLKG